MTVRIAPILWLCLGVGAGGCNPKQAPGRLAPDVASDTTTPPMPADFAPPADSIRTLAVPDDPVVRYYRNIIGIVFDDTTSAATVNAVFRKYQAVVVGGMPDWGNRGAYIVEVPDTVTTYQGLQSFIENVGGEIGVDLAFGETWRDKLVPRGRYPVDGMASDTTRPVMPTTTNWPLENPLLVTVPYNPSLKNFRDVFGIQFDDTTSGTTIRAFLAHFSAAIIGGFGHGSSAPSYVVRVPDPGTTFEAVDSLKTAMDAYGGVESAMGMNYEGSLRLRKSD